ncbi:MAG: hypothetical protein KVP17_003592 [Porospora cf. gigantea B]|uniref:uncharacterized protein n=1 Tax=Porospora cf. gigantea B TaxID=2853592 RepID=UPI0035718AA5|nr:MAG: hypothetical protein KVP17_003592 [Porospora cf. gigantea B]
MFIKGNCFVGQRVQLVDNHRLAAKYPLKNIMWHRGTEEGHEIVFSPVPFAEGSRVVTIPESALGSYIKAEGHRVLPTEERDVHDDMFFDPHLHEQDDLTDATVKRSFSVTSGPVMIAPEWALRTLPLLVDPPFVVEFLNFDQSGKLHLSYEGFWVEDRAQEQKKSAMNWMKSMSAEDQETPDVKSWVDFRCEVRFSHRGVATLHFVGEETAYMFIVKAAVFWQAAIFCWLMCDSQGRNDKAKWQRWHERSDVDAIMKATVKYLPTMK